MLITHKLHKNEKLKNRNRKIEMECWLLREYNGCQRLTIRLPPVYMMVMVLWWARARDVRPESFWTTFMCIYMEVLSKRNLVIHVSICVYVLYMLWCALVFPIFLATESTVVRHEDGQLPKLNTVRQETYATASDTPYAKSFTPRSLIRHTPLCSQIVHCAYAKK